MCTSRRSGCGVIVCKPVFNPLFNPLLQAEVSGIRARIRAPIVSLCAKNDDLIRRTRSQRAAGAGDRVVELKRPLGVVLE